jgi:gas vesicle protein
VRFVLGLLLGLMLGATLGLLLAPQPGTEMRRALGERLRRSSEAEEEI